MTMSHTFYDQIRRFEHVIYFRMHYCYILEQPKTIMHAELNNAFKSSNLITMCYIKMFKNKLCYIKVFKNKMF